MPGTMKPQTPSLQSAHVARLWRCWAHSAALQRPARLEKLRHHAQLRRRQRRRQGPGTDADATAAAGAAAQQQQHQPPNAALDWLVSSSGAVPSAPKIERRYMGEEQGFGMVAVADAEPGEVLLSVPLTVAISSEGADEARWSAHMALELLRRAADPAWQPWVGALPQHVSLPWLYWSEEEVAALQDPDAIRECQQLRGIFEDACEEGSGHSPERLAWALSLIHSRSFLENRTHLLVPGIDFCNHVEAPNAGVRCVHSPGSCQGAAAVEDVCPPPPLEPSRFELLAGDEGIGAGDEVTISYGNWPADVFLFFFGFVPAELSSAESVVLFTGLPDLAACYHRVSAQQAQQQQQQGGGSGQAAAGPSSGGGGGWEPDGWDRSQLAMLGERLQRVLGPYEDFSRLVVTTVGFDQRLPQAASALAQLYPEYFNISQPLPLQEFFRLRCLELLAGYPTSLEEDEAWLDGGEGQAASEAMRTAVRFRMAKKGVLAAAAEALA